jgi:hypothetical protein
VTSDRAGFSVSVVGAAPLRSERMRGRFDSDTDRRERPVSTTLLATTV